MIYLIGSLRNPEVPKIAKRLREEGLDIFAEWYAAGETADDSWRDYEKSQGYTYLDALSRPAAKNVFAFDRTHLDRSDTVVLLLPAGRSGFLEFGYSVGRGKRGIILLDSPDRWDVMLQFATSIVTTTEELIEALNTPTDIIRQVWYPAIGVPTAPNTSSAGCSCTLCLGAGGSSGGSGRIDG